MAKDVWRYHRTYGEEQFRIGNVTLEVRIQKEMALNLGGLYRVEDHALGRPGYCRIARQR